MAGCGLDAITSASKQNGEIRGKGKAKHTVENVERRMVEMAAAAWAVFHLSFFTVASALRRTDETSSMQRYYVAEDLEWLIHNL